MMLLIQVLWFIAPAGLANMSAVFAAKLFPRYTFPLDGNRTFRNKRILGDHKTVRGLLFGILTGYLIFLLQKHLVSTYAYVESFTVFPYKSTSDLIGILFGFGALGGDALKSFFKRQKNIDPGKAWIPFDQIDWILGSFLCTSPFISYDWKFIVATVCIGFALHLIIKLIGYAIKLQAEYL
jgi:CDP-2,3-bis-(O-geranylgeranyl)-sn-glycerol synthase